MDPLTEDLMNNVFSYDDKEKPDIFISYAREDTSQQAAAEIRNALEIYGASGPDVERLSSERSDLEKLWIWQDVDAFKPGDDWRQKIIDNSEAAFALVALLSKDYITRVAEVRDLRNDFKGDPTSSIALIDRQDHTAEQTASSATISIESEQFGVDRPNDTALENTAEPREFTRYEAYAALRRRALIPAIIDPNFPPSKIPQPIKHLQYVNLIPPSVFHPINAARAELTVKQWLTLETTESSPIGEAAQDAAEDQCASEDETPRVPPQGRLKDIETELALEDLQAERRTALIQERRPLLIACATSFSTLFQADEISPFPTEIAQLSDNGLRKRLDRAATIKKEQLSARLGAINARRDALTKRLFDWANADSQKKFEKGIERVIGKLRENRREYYASPQFKLMQRVQQLTRRIEYENSNAISSIASRMDKLGQQLDRLEQNPSRQPGARPSPGGWLSPLLTLAFLLGTLILALALSSPPNTRNPALDAAQRPLSQSYVDLTLFRFHPTTYQTSFDPEIQSLVTCLNGVNFYTVKNICDDNHRHLFEAAERLKSIPRKIRSGDTLAGMSGDASARGWFTNVAYFMNRDTFCGASTGPPRSPETALFADKELNLPIIPLAWNNQDDGALFTACGVSATPLD